MLDLNLDILWWVHGKKYETLLEARKLNFVNSSTDIFLKEIHTMMHFEASVVHVPPPTHT